MHMIDLKRSPKKYRSSLEWMILKARQGVSRGSTPVQQMELLKTRCQALLNSNRKHWKEFGEALKIVLDKMSILDLNVSPIEVPLIEMRIALMEGRQTNLGNWFMNWLRKKIFMPLNKLLQWRDVPETQSSLKYQFISTL